ncbi:MAG: OmpA family protein [Saprospiraceae bacterium]
MENKGRLFLLLGIIGLFVLSKVACNKSDGNHPGYEYMPDMAHSIAYEANVENYYSLNRWSSEEEYMEYAQPRKPISGTVPRGQAGFLSRQGEAKDAVANAMQGMAPNGFVPYYYGNTEEERTLAMNDSKVSRANYMPSITESEMAQAKELYDIFCGICHGEKGDGAGYLVRDGGKYPAAPSNYLNEEFLGATDGRYYHAIMHGKNVMGSYKDKVSFKERWMIIHYIRSLQHKATDSTGTAYPFLAVAGAEVEAQAEAFSVDAAEALIDEILSGEGAANTGEENVGGAADKALILENVFFNTGSSELKSESKIELGKLIAVLTTNKSVKIQINGHTDNVGNPDKNKSLSNDRAKAVFDYLIGNGITEDRLTFKGFGDTRPIASNDTDDGKRRNRRTDFIILK